MALASMIGQLSPDRAWSSQFRLKSCFQMKGMRTDLQILEQRNNDIAGEIAEGMLRTVNRNHRQILEAAQKEWECKYAGSDPSDACVSVCIGSDEPRKIAHYSPPAPAAREETLLASANR